MRTECVEGEKKNFKDHQVYTSCLIDESVWFATDHMAGIYGNMQASG